MEIPIREQDASYCSAHAFLFFGSNSCSFAAGEGNERLCVYEFLRHEEKYWDKESKEVGLW